MHAMTRSMIEVTQGEGVADTGQGKVSFSGIEVDIESVGMGFLLSALAACTAKRVAKELGIGSRVRAVIRGLVPVDKLIEEGEPPLEAVVVEVYVPEEVDENSVREQVYKCPGIGMIRHLVREVIVRRDAS